MPLHDDHAFVLRTYKLAEADKICVLMTQRYGKLRGIAYGAQKMRSRFGSSLEPLTEISLTWFAKEGRELVSISNAEIVHSHFAQATGSVVTGAAVSYLSELLCEFLPDHDPNETVYRLVRATLDVLDEEHLTALVRYFEVWLLKLSGFYPNLDHCTNCGGISPGSETVWVASDGTPRCRTCSGERGLRVGPRMRTTLGRILSESPRAFISNPPPADELERFSEMGYFITRHALERDLKSFSLFNRLRREMEQLPISDSGELQ